MKKLFLTFVILFAHFYVFSQKIQPIYTSTIPNEDKNIYHKLHIPLASTFSTDEIVSHLKNHFPEIKETQSDLQVFSDIKSPGGRHLYFYQFFQNLYVYNGGIKININNQNVIINALNHLQIFEPKIYGSNAYDLNIFLKEQENKLKGNPEFGIFHEPIAFNLNGKIRRAYLVWTQMDNQHNSQEWIIDAESGATLHHRILTSFKNYKPLVDTTGKGLVFIPDPLTKANVTYGGSYIDNNDADVTVLNQQRDTVTLKNLTYSNGTFMLDGPYVKITEFESPTVQPVTTSNGNFFYGRAASGFEDVNAYYHIDTMQRYIQSLGFSNLANFQILVDTHSNFGQDNSYYTSSPSPRLAFGEGGVDDAEDADVIVHEYGHALSASGSPGSNNGNQRQGQDEGIGDYIAASYSKRINTFNWFNIFSWDGHNTYWNGRLCNITTKYPNINGSNFYNYGELWCTVLMQVWNNVGREVSDKVFFQHLYMNAANQSLADAAEIVLDADSLLYNGQHTFAYLQAFCDKQLITGQRCTLTRSNDPLQNPQNPFTLFPNPASYSITLQKNNDQPYKAAIFNLVGQKIMELNISQYQTEIPIRHLPDGIYFITLENNNQLYTLKFTKQS